MEELEIFLKQIDHFTDVAPFLPEKETISEKEFIKLIGKLSRKFDEVNVLYQEAFPYLYLLLQKMKEKKAPLSTHFETHLLLPIIYNHLYPYFEEMITKTKIQEDSLKYLQYGSSNFVFSTDDKVLKIGNRKITFDFPIFYRINDLIVQRQFPIQNGEGHIYFEVSPKGKIVPLSKEDLFDIERDFSDAGIVVTDPNFAQNFALFDEEWKPDGYKDVEGEHPVIDLTPSKAYQKRKIKLIDLDYIYRQNHSQKQYAPKL